MLPLYPAEQAHVSGAVQFELCMQFGEQIANKKKEKYILFTEISIFIQRILTSSAYTIFPTCSTITSIGIRTISIDT